MGCFIVQIITIVTSLIFLWTPTMYEVEKSNAACTRADLRYPSPVGSILCERVLFCCCSFFFFLSFLLSLAYIYIPNRHVESYVPVIHPPSLPFSLSLSLTHTHVLSLSLSLSVLVLLNRVDSLCGQSLWTIFLVQKGSFSTSLSLLPTKPRNNNKKERQILQQLPSTNGHVLSYQEWFHHHNSQKQQQQQYEYEEQDIHVVTPIIFISSFFSNRSHSSSKETTTLDDPW